MHIDATEKKWMYVTAFMSIMIIGIVTGDAIRHNIHPPSNVEPIDSVSLHLNKEFAEDNLGVKKDADGNLTVTMVAARYGFYPQHITVPSDTLIKFRIASADVLHGVNAAFTNLDLMVVPGFVSQETTSFPKAGEYPMFCNEYCGLGHDYMWSKLTVVPKDDFTL